MLLIVVQISLGIVALISATNPSAFIFFGVAHQFTAMLLVICITSLLFLVKRFKQAAAV